MSAPGIAAEPAFGPFGSRLHPVTTEARPQKPVRTVSASQTVPSTFLYLSYEFYRRALSPIDGPRCVHRPTCSRYALIAVQSHPVLGVMLAVDRLWRATDSSALRQLPRWDDGNSVAFLDPLGESDFWLQRRPSEH